MAKQHFFLKEEWIGARDIPTTLDMKSVQNSYALFCPTCTNIWARMMHEHPESYCQPLTRFCPDHARLASDGTFSSEMIIPGHALGDIQTMPKKAQVFDVASLSNFFLNHPERWYRS